MQPLLDASEESSVNGRESTRPVKDSRGYLPPEIWWYIVGLLPLNDIYCLGLAEPGIRDLSTIAWEICLQTLNFVELDRRQRCSVLRKLYEQRHTRLGKLKSLLRLSGESLEREHKFRGMLLEEAIRRNDEDLAFLSLSRGKDQDELAVGLRYSVKLQQYSMVEFFLALGAPVDVRGDSEEPRSSLQIACDHADVQLTDLLLRYDHVYRRTILHAAASFGSYDLVDKLHKSQRVEILKGVKSSNGHLPMHSAVFAADHRMVQLLSSIGCSIHTTESHGLNLLHIVVYFWTISAQHEEAYRSILKWLIAEGCDHTARNMYGETPLECAKSQFPPPQWAIDDLQRLESMDSSTQQSALQVDMGERPNHLIVITDDEGETGTS